MMIIDQFRGVRIAQDRANLACHVAKLLVRAADRAAWTTELTPCAAQHSLRVLVPSAQARHEGQGQVRITDEKTAYRASGTAQ